MPFIIKTGHFEANAGEIISFTETPFYGGNEIRAGDVVYIWGCLTQGGDELSWYGLVQGSPTPCGSKINISVRLECQAPENCFGIDDLKPHRNDFKMGERTPIAGLADKLYTQTHRKIAKLTSAEAELLHSHFI